MSGSTPVPAAKRIATLLKLNEDKTNEIKRTQRLLAASEKELLTAKAMLDRYATIKPADMKVPAWLKPKGKRRARTATPVLMLSDLHLDEVVDLHEMDGINEYNREIATQRLDRVVNGAVDLLKNYISGVHYDGVVVPLLGDIITGEIHEELTKTNEAPVPATIVHWVPLLASALRHISDEFGPVFVPCVAGNHDRTTFKTPTKKRMESSYSWLIYSWLADTLRDRPEITFGISTSPEQLINVYDTRFLLAHGDAFRSQGGVGGLYPALLKWLYRRHGLYSQTKNDFDFALIGHWHSLLWGTDFIINGSLKGYDEFARHYGFHFERPQQALFLVTPERGITHRVPVHAD